MCTTVQSAHEWLKLNLRLKHKSDATQRSCDNSTPHADIGTAPKANLNPSRPCL